MKNIIVPTDFSKNAYNALSYARLLLQDDEVVFTLCHAYEPSPIKLLGKSPHRTGVLYNSYKQTAQEKLQQLLSKINSLNENSKHTYKVQAYGATLEDAIKSIPRDSYDLIIMGSKGATSLQNVLWGSNTYRIVNADIKKPLLIIPEKAMYRRPKKIGFATNFTRNYSKEELQPLIDLTKKWNASLRMVEVYYDRILSPKQEKHLKVLEDLLTDIDCNFHVIPHLNTIEVAISIFNSELEIDVLAKNNLKAEHNRGYLREPVIKKMVHHTTIPFLVLPSLTD